MNPSLTLTQSKQEAEMDTALFINSCDDLTSRDVPRLDGARGKKQVWQTHVQTWVFLGVKVLYWRKYLRHCWDILVPRALCPICPLSLHPCWPGIEFSLPALLVHAELTASVGHLILLVVNLKYISCYAVRCLRPFVLCMLIIDCSTWAD